MKFSNNLLLLCLITMKTVVCDEEYEKEEDYSGEYNYEEWCGDYDYEYDYDREERGGNPGNYYYETK